jgi:hypothetical protein
VDVTHVNLLAVYRKARDDRDSERDSFRSDTKVADVDAGMASLRGMFANKPAVSGNPEDPGELDAME